MNPTGARTILLSLAEWRRYCARDEDLHQTLGLEKIDFDSSIISARKTFSASGGTESAAESLPRLIVNNNNWAVGTLSFNHLDIVAGSLEVGFNIGKSYRGKGYATFGLHHAISTLPEAYTRIIAHVSSDNFASRRVVLKNGFRLVRRNIQLSIDTFECLLERK